MEPFAQALFDAIKEFGIIEEKKLTAAFEESKKNNTSFQERLIGNDLISDVDLGKTVADISTALDAQFETTTNCVYKDYLEKIKSGVEKGKSIEEVLSKTNKKFMPLIAVRMIGVGEKTGKLDETFVYLGDYFEDEVDDTSKNLSTILEPVILIVVGLIVGFIAISIIGPIYQFTGSIKR